MGLLLGTYFLEGNHYGLFSFSESQKKIKAAYPNSAQFRTASTLVVSVLASLDCDPFDVGSLTTVSTSLARD